MLSNLHTHTTLCDGANSAEEMLLSAIEKGFDSLGFSGHGYTDFDLSYCMRDMDGYIAEIRGLSQKYKDKIRVYVGVEEDARCPIDRTRFDYLIGSCHYSVKDGVYYSIDSSPEHFAKCLDAWGGDGAALAEEYYGSFCDYILKRRPDIIGHFDLLTKYREIGVGKFFASAEYQRIAKKYIKVALGANCIFEVNTGAMARGYRTSPYPDIELLRVIKNEGGRVTLSSDSHNIDTLDFAFDEARALLRDVGFRELWVMSDGVFKPVAT